MAEFFSCRPIALRPQFSLSLPFSIYVQYTRFQAPSYCNCIAATLQKPFSKGLRKELLEVLRFSQRNSLHAAINPSEQAC
jgi:hypothetical protein